MAGTTLYKSHPATPASNSTVSMCHDTRLAAAGICQAHTTAIANGRDRYVSNVIRVRTRLPYMILPIQKLG